MSKVELFQGFDEEKQKQYEEEARGQWGETVETSVQRWGSYDKRRQQEILTEGDAIYANIAANMAKGPESNDVQLLLTQWHAHIRNFYEPSTEILAGLGDMYHDHPEFNANFAAIHPELPSFLKLAIAHYVHSLT